MALLKPTLHLPDSADLAQIEALLLQGRLLDAYTFASRFAPMDQWLSASAIATAARLVRMLGAPRRAAAMNLRLLRREPKDCTAIRNVAFRHLERFGAYRALCFLQENPVPVNAADDLKADWLGAYSCALTVLRDFDAAEEALHRAQALDPKDPWLWVQECFLFRQSDRFPEALKAAEISVEKGPGYPAALESLADAYVSLGRPDEGRELLEKAVGPVQSPALCLWLADRFTESGKAARALRYLNQFESWAPLMEVEVRDALESRRAMVLHRTGKSDEARAAAEKVKNHGFYKKMAERLGAVKKGAKRHVLDVPFQKQRHMFCAPATMAMLSTFFGKVTDQDTIADGITYDGTPAHKQREWAESDGWLVREFTLTWETAVALLDQDIPFAITTVAVTSSHLQAVVGYDSSLGTVLLRDPTVDQLLDAYADSLIEDHKGLGPRCFLMLPKEREKDLAKIPLNDCGAYALAARVDAALEHHDAAEARTIAKELAESVGADHFLAITANYRLARIDRDHAGALKLSEKLLAFNPTSPRLRQIYLSALEADGLETRRREFLEQICSASHPHPRFLQQLADILRKDSRKEVATRRLLNRILAAMPGDASALWSMGTLEYARGQYDKAAALYRFASCIEPMKEGLARDYYLAARSAAKDGECEKYLRRRWELLGNDRGDAAATLSWALFGMGRIDEAIAVYEPAALRCPEDENLKLSAARSCLQVGRVADAKAWLARIPNPKNTRSVAEVTAMVAERSGDPKSALEVWRKQVTEDVLDIGAQEQVVRLMTETEGNDAAERYLTALVAQHPTQPTLVRLLAERLRYDTGRAEAPLQQLVSLVPNDCWALNELAIVAIKTGRFDEADAYVTRSHAIDSHGSGVHNIRAMLENHRGNAQGALDHAKLALHHNVDNGWAISFAFDVAGSEASRASFADFLEGEMRAQSTNGAAIDAYCGLAPERLPNERRLAFLRSLIAEQPDLYVLRRARVRLLRNLKRDAEALKEAEAIVRRWPSDSDDWLTLASLRESAEDTSGKVAALERAAACAPLALPPLLALAQHHESQGDIASERTVLRRALLNAPFNAMVYGYLADCDLREKKTVDAWPLLVRAVQLNPAYAWAWDALRQLSETPAMKKKFNEFVRSLAEARPRSTEMWMRLADTLTDPEQLSERLSAIDRVLTINPLIEEAHGRRITALASVRRHEEALAASRTGAWGARRRPALLRWHEGAQLNQLQRHDEAREVLEQLTAEVPDYSAGWRLLADTYEKLSLWADYDRVTGELVRRFPEAATSHGYYADSLRRGGDVEGAMVAFNQALDIEKSYFWAAKHLWRLSDGRDLKIRTAALGRLRIASGDEAPLYLEGLALLAVERGDKAAALEAMVRLCSVVRDRDDATGSALGAIVGKGWSADLREALEPAVRTTSYRAAAPIWCELSAKAVGAQWPKMADAFLRTLEDAAVAGWVAMCLVENFGDNKDAAGLATFLASAHSIVYSFPSAWAMTGWALGAIEIRPALAPWLEGWRERPDLRSLPLLYVANAARDLERFDDVFEAHRRAVAQPDDANSALHWRWFAFESVLRGDLRGAQEALSQSERRDTTLSTALLVQDVTELLVEYFTAQMRGEPPSLLNACRTLRALGVRYSGKAWEKYRKQVIARAFRALSQATPGVAGRLVPLLFATSGRKLKFDLRTAVLFFVAAALIRLAFRH